MGQLDNWIRRILFPWDVLNNDIYISILNKMDKTRQRCVFKNDIIDVLPFNLLIPLVWDGK